MRYHDDKRLWEYPTDATRQAIIELLHMQFYQLWYREHRP